ncbi:MAG: SPOR domain-containing protein, partial [Candidatus Eisenbacteria bacterium]
PAATAPITARLGAGPAVPTTAPPKQILGASAALTTAPPADGKKYRVHVASFRSEVKVAPIVRDLRLKGLDAWFESASDAPGWYRVFVGRFATEDEAAAYASWLLHNKWVDRAHAFPSTSR